MILYAIIAALSLANAVVWTNYRAAKRSAQLAIKLFSKPNRQKEPK